MKDLLIDLIDNLPVSNKTRRVLLIIVILFLIILSVAAFSFKLYEKHKNRFLTHRQGFLKRINHTRSLFAECDNLIHNVNRSSETIHYLKEIDESIRKIYVWYSNNSIQLQKYSMLMRDLNQRRVDLDIKWIYFCNKDAFISTGGHFGRMERNWDALDVTKSELKKLYKKTQVSLTNLRAAVVDDIPLKYTVQNDEEE